MRPLSIAAALLLAVSACGGTPAGPTAPPPPPPAPTPAAIGIVAGNHQSAPAGTALPLEPVVLVQDAGGRALPGIIVGFTVTSGAGWVSEGSAMTGTDGRASTAWYLGPVPGAAQRLAVSVGALSATIEATAVALVPGMTYLGHNGYIEFIAGDGPFVLSAPHGGALTPATIPDRTVGTTVTDTNTDPMIRAMGSAIALESGRRPHLVISRLRRTKLDPNREVVEAAAGNPEAIRAWREYHGFIEAARVAAAAAWPHAFYIDVHGHGHTIPRLEWGYLLGASTLDRPDLELNSGSHAAQSSIHSLAALGVAPFATLLRGAASLGARFEAEGYPSVPSPSAPSPGTADYFNGGYSSARHGSRDGGTVSGVQLEMHYPGVRDTEANRLAFAAAAARVLVGWLGMFP